MIVNLLLNIVLIIISFYIITKAADYFIDESATIGYYYKIPKLVIGLTIVAIGTSLPELFTSIVSFFFTENFSDFTIGTIMGSNISNILLVFGMFLIFAKSFTIKKNEKVDIYVLLLVTIIFLGFVLIGFVNYFAIILIIIYIIYIYYLATFRKAEIITEESEIVEIKKETLKKSYLILTLSFLGLLGGTKLVVYAIENVGDILQIPTAYLTLTVIAAATSFPEVAVSIASAKKKEYLLGIGNIMGSNIINIAFVFGLSGFFGYYAIDNSNYIYSIVFLLFSTIIFSLLILKKKFIGSVGWIFVMFYGVYLITFFI